MTIKRNLNIPENVFLHPLLRLFTDSRTGWRVSRPRMRRRRPTWRSARWGWRPTPPPSVRWAPWLVSWPWLTLGASTGDVTLDLMALPSRWTGEKCFYQFLPVHLPEPGLSLQLIRYSAGY